MSGSLENFLKDVEATILFCLDFTALESFSLKVDFFTVFLAYAGLVFHCVFFVLRSYYRESMFVTSHWFRTNPSILHIACQEL